MDKDGANPQFFTDIATFYGDMPSLPPPPLSTYRGFLKRINTETLPEDKKTALGLAAPYFSERLIFKNELDALRDFIYCGRKRSFDEATQLNKHSARRYSGGDNLSRGRYYTLAKDADGDDGGTLRCEIFAYQSIYWSGMTLVEDSEFLDMFLPAENLKKLLRRFSKSILIYFFNTEDAPHRFFWQPGSEPLVMDLVQQTPSGELRGAGLALPYEVMHHEIDNVLDLRERDAQDWLVRIAKDRKLQLNYVGKDVPIYDNFSFFDLLRYLLSPINGGGIMTDIIGAYLRRLGVSGLIYPSARYDSSVEYNNRRLVNFDGWNFLDLRSAAINSNILEFNREVYDLSLLDFLYTTNFETSGVKEGSWKRNSISIQYSRIQAEDLAKIRSETKDQREFRMRDYRLYWKTIGLVRDGGFYSYLRQCMSECGLSGAPEDISPRMWQYVLSEVLPDLQVPKLDDAKCSTLPLDLRLIGNQ